MLVGVISKHIPGVVHGVSAAFAYDTRGLRPDERPEPTVCVDCEREDAEDGSLTCARCKADLARGW